MDLGVKEKPLSEPASPAKSKEEPKVSYPSFSVRDEKAEELRNEFDCDVEEEYTANVRIRVSGNTKDKYTNSLQFDIISMDDIQETGSDNDEDDKEEESALGYKRPKKDDSEAPPVAAKDLED